MTTSLAIATTVEHVRDRLGQFFSLLPSTGSGISDHYTDNVQDLVSRVLMKGRQGQNRGADLLMNRGRWWSFYFTRSGISPIVDRPKDLAGKIGVNTPQERYIRVRVLPYSRVNLDYNIVSNDMELLEDLEEAVHLRTTTLTQEFTIEIENTDFSFSMQYAFDLENLTYRVAPSELGTLSVVSFPIEIRYPLLFFHETVKEIRVIRFRIFLHGSNQPIKVYEIRPTQGP